MAGVGDKEEKKARTRRRPNVWWVAVVSGMASFIDLLALYATATALVIYQHHLHFRTWTTASSRR